MFLANARIWRQIVVVFNTNKGLEFRAELLRTLSMNEESGLTNPRFPSERWGDATSVAEKNRTYDNSHGETGERVRRVERRRALSATTVRIEETSVEEVRSVGRP